MSRHGRIAALWGLVSVSATAWAAKPIEGPGPGGGEPRAIGCRVDADCALDQVCDPLLKKQIASTEQVLVPGGEGPVGPWGSLLRPFGVCIRDRVPPVALLPELPGYTATDTVWVTGQVLDNRWVQSAQFTKDGATSATAFWPGDTVASTVLSVPAPDGAHVVVLMAWDAAGNTGSATGLVIRDTRIPKFRLNAPVDGVVFGTSAVPSTVTIGEINPATIKVGTIAGGFVSIAHPGAASTLQYPVVLTVPEGQHEIVATAVDAASNATSDTATVIVDLTAPVVATTLPDGLVLSTSSCENPWPDDHLTWSFEVADLTATTITAPAGSAISVAGTPRGGGVVDVMTTLQSGTNVLSFTITDEAGHTTTLTRTVEHDDRPAFTIDAATTLYVTPAWTPGIPTEDIAFNAKYLAKSLGVTFTMGSPPPGATNAIVLGRPDRASPPDPYDVDAQPSPGQLPFEGFKVIVAPDRITVKSGDPRGQRYGAQWLVENLDDDGSWCTGEIEDHPALGLRAVHLGNYDVQDVIDAIPDIATSRINVIQWQVRMDVPLPALGVAQGGTCPDGATSPVPYTVAQIDKMLLTAAEHQIVFVPSVKTLTHQEKWFAESTLYAVDSPCPDADAAAARTVEQRVNEAWPDPDGTGPEYGLLLPRTCPSWEPDCKSALYNPTYPGLYDDLVFPILDDVVALFSHVRPVLAVHVGHDEALDGVLTLLADSLGDGTTPAQLFADDVVAIHDHLAARRLWVLMWGDMMIPAHGKPAGQVGLEVTPTPDEEPCAAVPPEGQEACTFAYFEDSVHGDRDFVGVRGPDGAFEMLQNAFCRGPNQMGYCATPYGNHLRIEDWHYFNPYADYPSGAYLEGLAPVYGATWHRDDYVVAHTRAVADRGGHGMVATSWGFPTGVNEAMARHIIEFGGATYWTAGEPIEGQFGWDPRPNLAPLDSEILVTRRVNGQDVVSDLLAPGDEGAIWVRGEDAESAQSEFAPSEWYLQIGAGQPNVHVAAQYVAAGAPGAPDHPWRLPFTIPVDATRGSKFVKVRYSDSPGGLANETVHDDALRVGWTDGPNLVVDPGFDHVDEVGFEDAWVVERSYPVNATIVQAAHDGAALRIQVDGSRCPTCDYDDSCPDDAVAYTCPYDGAGASPVELEAAACEAARFSLGWTGTACQCEPGFEWTGTKCQECGCEFLGAGDLNGAHQLVAVTPGREYLLRYWIHTDGRQEPGPDRDRNRSAVQVQSFAADQTTWTCWPGAFDTGVNDTCSKKVFGSSRATQDGWRQVEAVLVPGPGTAWLDLRADQVNRGPVSTGFAEYDDFELVEIVDTPNVLFTQYVEGLAPTSQAVEVTNLGRREWIDLAQCGVQVRGGAAVLPLTAGPLQPGDSWVVCRTGAPFPECDQFAGDNDGNGTDDLGFDGNDWVRLRCYGQFVDVIGQTGVPAVVWGTGSLTTRDHDLHRECQVEGGDPDGTDEFDPADEWWTPTGGSPDAPTDLGWFDCEP